MDNDAFRIHKPEIFFREIVPGYFKHSRLSSFKRQLNLYGFVLVVRGAAQGGYRHELFRKDEPMLCRKIRRVAIKQQPQQPVRPTTNETSLTSDHVDAIHSNLQDHRTSLRDDLDDDTELQYDSIGSTERSDMLLNMPDGDHESVVLNDAPSLDGLISFEPPPL